MNARRSSFVRAKFESGESEIGQFGSDLGSNSWKSPRDRNLATALEGRARIIRPSNASERGVFRHRVPNRDYWKLYRLWRDAERHQAAVRMALLHLLLRRLLHGGLHAEAHSFHKALVPGSLNRRLRGLGGYLSAPSLAPWAGALSAAAPRGGLAAGKDGRGGAGDRRGCSHTRSADVE